ncbi:xylose isomerase tim barrel [Colletotrichum incanum]|uniref:Xylose isomerase tim barrel n=1 Tax=Colletotrichum incanum TaxID=1573173 RepID=A0A166ZKT3_COLIC|nr:xylose isomerase tim barrel [Colletotrichum incanum]
MPNIARFRTLWGIPAGDKFANWIALFPDLKAKGYTGVEIDYSEIPTEELFELRRILDRFGFQVVAQIMSSWQGYLGPRPPGLTPNDHLDFYRKSLERAQILKPVKVNAQSGRRSDSHLELSDIWTLDQSVEFYRGTFRIDEKLGFAGRVTHETHRNRSLFTPYATKYILEKVPNLRITADISHWVVVSERLLDESEEDKEILEKVIPHVYHVHARIGTTQASQCADPADPIYTPEREFFEKFWVKVIQNSATRGDDYQISFTPEYGYVFIKTETLLQKVVTEIHGTDFKFRKRPYPYHPHHSPRLYTEVADTEGARLEGLFLAAI